MPVVASGGGASKVLQGRCGETGPNLTQRFFSFGREISRRGDQSRLVGPASPAAGKIQSRRCRERQGGSPVAAEGSSQSVAADPSRKLQPVNNFRRTDVLFGQREIMAALGLSRTQTALLIDAAAFPTTLLADRRCALRADVDNWISDQKALLTWADDGGPSFPKDPD